MEEERARTKKEGKEGKKKGRREEGEWEGGDMNGTPGSLIVW